MNVLQMLVQAVTRQQNCTQDYTLGRARKNIQHWLTINTQDSWNEHILQQYVASSELYFYTFLLFLMHFNMLEMFLRIPSALKATAQDYNSKYKTAQKRESSAKKSSFYRQEIRCTICQAGQLPFFPANNNAETIPSCHSKIWRLLSMLFFFLIIVISFTWLKYVKSSVGSNR